MLINDHTQPMIWSSSMSSISMFGLTAAHKRNLSGHRIFEG